MLRGTTRRRFQEPTAARMGQLVAGADRIGLCGRFSAIDTHVHAAPAVVIGVDGPLRILAADGRVHESRAVLMSPGFVHAVEAGGGRVGMFVLPPHATRAGGVPVRDLSDVGRWIELGRAVGELRDFSAVDDALARERLAPRPLHAGLRRALAALAGATEENLPVAALAATARLSPSRLMGLAREELGASLRAYRRWLRTFEVARAYAAGRSLTEAALEAGFSSSAHLSAAARAHFGVRPSEMLSPHNRAGIRALEAP